MSKKIVYLMRGLPSCGKSYRARELAGDHGIICETDQYFYTEVGDNPKAYNYDDSLLTVARDWNLTNFRNAVEQQHPIVVVDRGNGLNAETYDYIKIARDLQYDVQFAEPTSAWWKELRVLLKYRSYVSGELFDLWADTLAQENRETHRAKSSTIRRWMASWKYDLTVDDVCDAADQGDL